MVLVCNRYQIDRVQRSGVTSLRLELGVAIIPRNSLSETDQKAIREQLDRLLRSRQFEKSRRRRQFLEYIVNETLSGRSDRLTGYSLALEVFGRPDTFDPIVDPVVRVEAARLRDKLREYYAGDGQHDPIRIDLPKGTYAPQIEVRHESRVPRRTAPQSHEISSTVPSVAVLSFDDLSADQNLAYLGDGVAEDVITSLCRFPDLSGCRPWFVLRLQGQGCRSAAGRRRTRRRLRARRQRPQGGR